MYHSNVGTIAALLGIVTFEIVLSNLVLLWVTTGQVETLRQEIPPEWFEAQVTDHEARLRSLELQGHDHYE